MEYTNQKNEADNYYFSSPAAAIPIITDLLEKENFKILARYYDLEGSDIRLSELKSGEFFIRRERPEVAHPGGYWRYKHPFAPGFKYKGVQATARESIYMIEVSISIDQGPDSPEQLGMSHFYMIQSEKGWKILPEKVEM